MKMEITVDELNGLDKKQIQRCLLSLPIIEAPKVAEDNEILEVSIKKLKVHFKITKEGIKRTDPFTGQEASPLVFYMMSISGDPERKHKIIEWLEEFLGRAFNKFKMPRVKGIDYVSWNARKVDKKLKSE